MDSLKELENLTNRLNQPRGNWDWNLVTKELLWSGAVFRMFGLTLNTFDKTYEGFLDTVHEDDREAVKAAVDAALNDGAEYSIVHRIRLPDGSIRKVHEVAEVLFDSHGNAIRMTGMVQDITEFGRNSEEEWRALIFKLIDNGAQEIRELRKMVIENTIHVGIVKGIARRSGAVGATIPVGLGGLAYLIYRVVLVILEKSG